MVPPLDTGIVVTWGFVCCCCAPPNPAIFVALWELASLFPAACCWKACWNWLGAALPPVVVAVVVTCDWIVLAVTVRCDGDCKIWILGLLVVKTLVCWRLTRLPWEPTLRIVLELPVEPTPVWFCCCRIWICWVWAEPVELEGVNWNWRNCCGWFVVIMPMQKDGCWIS